MPLTSLPRRALRFARRRPLTTFLIVLTLVFAATLGTFILVGVWPGNVTFGSGAYEARMVVDSVGAFHVLVVNTSLVYMTNEGGAWATTILDPGYTYFSASIARGPRDQIHIVGEGFPSGTPHPPLGEIRYMTNTGGAWSATTLAAEGTAPSITVDPSAIVHIAYIWSNETTTGTRTTDFHLLTGTGGSWNDTVVYRLPGDATANSETDIAATPTGTVAISFVGASYFVALITNAVAPWTITWPAVLPGSGGMYGPAPVGIDSAGNVRLVFTVYNVTTNSTSLIHAVDTEGVWARETVAQTGGPVASSMVLDGADRVHLDYIDEGSGALYYATNAGGSWAREVIDPQADLYPGTSIAILPSGGVAVVYTAVRSGSQLFVRIAGSALAGWNAADFFATAAPVLTVELIVVALGVRVAGRSRRVPAK